MTRVQIVARPWGRGGSAEVGYRARELHPDLTLHLVQGVVEWPGGDAGDLIHDAFLATGDAGHRLEVGEGRAIVDEWGPIAGAEADEVTRYLERRVWAAPEAPIPGVLAGRLATRPCALEGAAGTTRRLVCGIMAGPADAFPCQFLHEGVREGASFRLSPSRRRLTLPAMGAAGSDVFAIPQWGWGEDPVGFRSTMALPAIQAMDAMRSFPPEAERTEAQAREWRRLDALCLGAASRSGREPEYARYLALLALEPGSGLGTPSEVPVTAEGIAGMERAARRAVEAMLRAA